jgi:hypothetical protein
MNHIPVTQAGYIELDEHGREIARYTPEEWQYKKIADKLEAIERRLNALEVRMSLRDSGEQGIDLEDAVRTEFNKKSVEVGSDIRL